MLHDIDLINYVIIEGYSRGFHYKIAFNQVPLNIRPLVSQQVSRWFVLETVIRRPLN